MGLRKGRHRHDPSRLAKTTEVYHTRIWAGSMSAEGDWFGAAQVSIPLLEAGANAEWRGGGSTGGPSSEASSRSPPGHSMGAATGMISCLVAVSLDTSCPPTSKGSEGTSPPDPKPHGGVV